MIALAPYRPLVAPPVRLQPKPMQLPGDLPALSPDESHQLELWKTRFQPQLGILQTPPTGETPAAPQAARAYLGELVQQLAGEELKKAGIQVRLEVFSGDIPQAGVDDTTVQERDWEAQHPDQPWPIRTWLEAPKDGNRALYRLCISDGLLRHLTTREEVGFVVAHELGRLLAEERKDPNNENEMKLSSQSWLDAHEMQAGQDMVALQMMTRAGLNPEGSLGALDKLYREFPLKYPKGDQKTALAAGAQGQEHEGLRVAILQAQVEQLRRTGHPSTLQPSQPIPDGLAPIAPSQYEVHVANFPAFQAAFQQVATQLASDATPAWMFGTQPPPPEVVQLRNTTACAEDYEMALTSVCEKLRSCEATPQQKVNGFLRTLMALKGDCLQPMSEKGQTAIRQFLADHSEWQAEPFLASLSGEGRSLHRELVQNLNFREPFQHFGILAGEAAANYCIRPQDGSQDPKALAQFLQQNNQEAQWPLVAAQNQGALDFLRRQDGAALAQAKDPLSGLSLGLATCNDLRKVDNLTPEFAEQLRQSMSPIQEAANQVRENQALLRLRPPLCEPEKLDAYLNGLFASEHGGAFSAQFEAQLPAVLQDLVRTVNHQSDLVWDSGRPAGLEEGLERRLCALPEKGEVLRFLSRQWAHELRLPTHSARRDWTEAVSRQLAEEGLPETNLDQHANLIRKSLMETYRLQESDVPDVSTETLKALNERREKGEFAPKPENYSDPAEYARETQAYRDRCQKLKLASRFLAPAEARLTLSPLAILGSDEGSSLKAAGQLKADQFVQILEKTEGAVERSKTLRKVCNDQGVEALGADAGAFLMDGFLATEKDIPEIDRFWDLAERTTRLSPAATEARPRTRTRFANSLFARLDQLPVEQLRGWLAKDHVMQSLKAHQSSALILKLLGDQVKPQPDIATLGQSVQGLDKDLKLQEKFPLVYVLVRDEVSEKSKLQPGNVDQVFPPSEDNPVQTISLFRGQASALSGLVAMSRNHSPLDQLATIEYLMGRREDMPEYLEAASENQSLAPVAQALRNARQELAEAEPIARVMVANSFLAGPNGLLHRPGGKEAIMTEMMSGVKPKFLDLAQTMTKAILSSQGDTDTLAVAFVLGQKPKNDVNAEGQVHKLSEADILNRVFDSYGVPGIKMKQYLAFTSEFESFREAFESAQDAAMPLTYFQVVKLIQKRFGADWPADLQVDKVLGSGSVNIAIRYTNQATGKREVVSLGRDAIEESTRYDFARFQKFVEALTADPKDQEKFGYIKGLSHIIQDSVTLEFDKESAMKVQKLAYSTYQHQYGDWKVRSIDAHKVQHLGLFMEEALGKTARKTLDQKPQLYKEAMRHMARAEFNLLKGRDASENILPRPNFANPDFHDGQVLIDEARKQVTILDFGQAVPINNEQREMGLDILTVISKVDFTRNQACNRLNKRFGLSLKAEDLNSIMERKKVMDRFVHLLSLLARNGADVPISTVHWVLALNRQMVLGEKLDQSIKLQLAGMVLNHKVGLPLGVFNAVQAANEKVWNVALGVAHAIGGWVGGTDLNQTKSLAPEQQDRFMDRPWHKDDGLGWYPFEPEETKK